MANYIQQCIYWDVCGNYTDGAGDGVCGDCYAKQLKVVRVEIREIPRRTK